MGHRRNYSGTLKILVIKALNINTGMEIYMGKEEGCILRRSISSAGSWGGEAHGKGGKPAPHEQRRVVQEASAASQPLL